MKSPRRLRRGDCSQSGKAVTAVVARTGIGIPEIKAGLALLKVCGTVSAAKEALAAAEDLKKAV